MAVQNITYDNKVALNTNPDIADTNKVTDSDMNMIKSVVNNNATETSNNTTNINNIIDGEVYSTTSIKTNKVWIDGKPIYRKVMQFTTTIQSNTLLTLSHNISNANYIYVESFHISNNVNGICYQFPLVGYNGNTTDKAYCYIDKTNLYMYSTGGWNTSWTKNVTIEYTKTTD